VNETMTVTCPRCGIQERITLMSYKQRENRGTRHFCIDCRDIARPKSSGLTDAQLGRLLDHARRLVHD
jgi:superfamily II helicase